MRRKTILLACLLIAGCAPSMSDVMRTDPIMRACFNNAGLSPDRAADCYDTYGTRACNAAIPPAQQDRAANCLEQAMAINEMLTPRPAVMVRTPPAYTNCTTIGYSTSCTTY